MIVYVLCALAVLLICAVVYLFSKLRRAVQTIDAAEKSLDCLKSCFTELKSSFDEVIADELDARAKSEKLFADGIESILNYGGEIPTLNKEDMRNDR